MTYSIYCYPYHSLILSCIGSAFLYKSRDFNDSSLVEKLIIPPSLKLKLTSIYNYPTNPCTFYRLYEGPRLDMPNIFATTSNLFLTCIFYSPLIPLSIPIGLVGMVIAYWVEKVSISHVHIIHPIHRQTYSEHIESLR